MCSTRILKRRKYFCKRVDGIPNNRVGAESRAGELDRDFETGRISLEDGIEDTEERLRHMTALFESSMLDCLQLARREGVVSRLWMSSVQSTYMSISGQSSCNMSAEPFRRNIIIGRLT